MPALTAIFGADASPFVTAMRTVEASTKGMANLTVAQMQRAIAEIEKRAAAELAAGRSTTFHAQAIAQLSGQMQALESRTRAATVAQERLAAARAAQAIAARSAPVQSAIAAVTQAQTAQVTVTADLSAAEKAVGQLETELAAVQSKKIKVEADTTDVLTKLTEARSIRDNLAQQKIKVTADVTSALAALKQAEAGVKAVKPVNLKINTDFAAAQTAATRAQDFLSQVTDKKIRIDADISGLTTKLDAARAKRDQLQGGPPAEFRASSQEVARLESQLARLKGQKIRIEADSTQAQAAVTQTKAALASLQPKRIEINAQADQAAAEVSRLKAVVANLKPQSVKITAEAAHAERTVQKLEASLKKLPATTTLKADSTNLLAKLDQAKARRDELAATKIKFDADISLAQQKLRTLQQLALGQGPATPNLGSLSDQPGLAARLARRLQSRRAEQQAAEAAAADRAEVARQMAVHNPEAEKRLLRRRFVQEEAPGFTGPRSLTPQQRLDVGIDTAARANRLSALRRQRDEERAERDKAKADAIAQGLSEQKAAEMARIAWIRSLRERRAARVLEKADIAAAAVAETNAARLASIGWIRALRERRMERAREAAEERIRRAAELAHLRQTTGLRGALNNLRAGLANRFLGVGAAIGAIYSIGRFIVESVRADITMQRIQNTLKTVSGSARQAGLDFQFLVSESSRIGFSFREAADGFARFAIAAKSAGLTSQATRAIFTSVMESSATMGLSAERTGEAMLALEQMLSKGTVAAQELRLQLGNAMPAAVNTMAKALGITVAQLFKALQTGAINSADAVQKFAAQLKQDFALTPEANKTARDLQKVANSWLMLKASVGEGLRNPLSNWLEGADEIARKWNLIAKLRTTGVLAGMDQASAFTTEAFTREVDALMAIDARIAQAEKKMAETRDARKPKAPPRDNEARELLASLDKEAEKQGALNQLLEQRLKLQDLLRDKTKLSADMITQLYEGLRAVNSAITVNQAGGPIAKSFAQLRALIDELQSAKAQLTEAQKRAASAKPAEAKSGAAAVEVLNSQVKVLSQKVAAKQEEIALGGVAGGELFNLLLRRIEIQDELKGKMPKERREVLQQELGQTERAITKENASGPKTKAETELSELDEEISGARLNFRKKLADAAKTKQLLDFLSGGSTSQSRQKRAQTREQFSTQLGELDAAKARVDASLQKKRAKEEEIELLAEKEKPERRTGQKITQFADEFERAGGGIGFGSPAIALLDVNKAQLIEIRGLRNDLKIARGNLRNTPRGVEF